MGDASRARGEVRLALALVGPGTVGAALLEQLRAEAPALKDKYGLDLALHSVTNSRCSLLSHGGAPLDAGAWRDRLLRDGTDASLGLVTEHLKTVPADARAVLDCTASAAVPRLYARWLDAGIHVVTPNKKLTSGPLDDYSAVKALQRAGAAHFLYEGACGAGLPIISTLKALLDTGDAVERIEGVFSGTLSHIFNSYAPAGGGEPFSAVVADAKAAGFTEPDPRDDLSGADVARKVLTLARECGLRAELADVPVRSLVPDALAACPAEEYLRHLPEHDAEMAALAAEAAAAGEVLRYVGVYDAGAGTCEAALRRFPRAHAFAGLAGTENIIAFTTRRYPAATPLIVRGPGAGPAVTAAGVFADVVQLGRYLGAAS